MLSDLVDVAETPSSDLEHHEVLRFCQQFSGVWEGESVNDDNGVSTRWLDTFLSFR
jgi:hypothetical protein